MEEGLDRGRKRKHSESLEAEGAHLVRSSLSPEILSPRRRSSSLQLPSATALPLTETNLRVLDPTMGPKAQHVASADTGIGQGETVRANREHLKTWNTYIDDPSARSRFHETIDQARHAIKGDRHSAMSSKSVDRVQATYKAVQRFNEGTFLPRFIEVLLKSSRLVKPEGIAEPVSRDWVSDDIVAASDQMFRTDCIVPNSTCTGSEKLLRNTLPNLRLPKPDYLWGLINENWCSEALIATIKQFGRYTMASPELVLPWGCAEGKGLEGKLEEALAQTARTGSVAIASFRRLDEIAGTIYTTDGADPRSQFFSLVLTTSSARFSVHFAEVQNGKVVAYHMHELHTYTTHQPEAWPDMRRDMNNLIEWGVLERRETVRALLTKLSEMGQSAVDRMVQLEDEDDAGRSSKKAKTGSDATGSSSGQGR